MLLEWKSDGNNFYEGEGVSEEAVCNLVLSQVDGVVRTNADKTTLGERGWAERTGGVKLSFVLRGWCWSE